MILNSDSANQLFQPLFEKFKLNHDCLSQCASEKKFEFENIFPRELRLFRVRLRLSIGLVVSFNKDFAMVKNEPTEKAYVEIIKCNEAWFAYESMNKMCKLWSLRKSSIQSPIDIFDSAMLDNFNIRDIVDLYNEQIKNQIYLKPNIANDIENYVTYLKTEVENSYLKNILNSVINKIKDKKEWQHKEILAVIYATRNIFVHKGETAKSGVEYYKNKILLLKMLFDYIILFQLKVINFAFERKITQYNLEL